MATRDGLQHNARDAEDTNAISFMEFIGPTLARPCRSYGAKTDRLFILIKFVAIASHVKSRGSRDSMQIV